MRPRSTTTLAARTPSVVTTRVPRMTNRSTSGGITPEASEEIDCDAPPILGRGSQIVDRMNLGREGGRGVLDRIVREKTLGLERPYDRRCDAAERHAWRRPTDPGDDNFRDCLCRARSDFPEP